MHSFLVGKLLLLVGGVVFLMFGELASAEMPSTIDSDREQQFTQIIQGEIWTDYLALHTSAIFSCQNDIDAPDLVVVWLEPLVQDVVISFRSHQQTFRCTVGAYGGQPEIIVGTTDQPLPEVMFTLLPAYPDYPCFTHKLIQNYAIDPPDAVGWLSTRYCQATPATKPTEILSTTGN